MITINSSGRLDLNGFNETVRSVTMNGGSIVTGAGTLTFTGASNNLTTHREHRVCDDQRECEPRRGGTNFPRGR